MGCDLADMQSFSRTNKGYQYLLTVIDVFSIYVTWVIPIKNKTGSHVIQVFQNVIKN